MSSIPFGAPLERLIVTTSDHLFSVVGPQRLEALVIRAHDDVGEAAVASRMAASSSKREIEAS